MIKRTISTVLLAVALLGINSQIIFAKQIGEWKDLSKQVNNEIAIKPSKGKTVFGKVISVSDTEIVVQIADKKELTNQNASFQRSEVKRVWIANLRFKDRTGVSTGIGAAVGAGAGGGIAYGSLVATGGSDSGQQFFWAAVAIGAGAGAVLGYFAGKRGHQKLGLVYEI